MPSKKKEELNENVENVKNVEKTTEEKKDGEIGGKTSVPKTDPEIEALKQKALFLQFLLEEK